MRKIAEIEEALAEAEAKFCDAQRRLRAAQADLEESLQTICVHQREFDEAVKAVRARSPAGSVWAVAGGYSTEKPGKPGRLDDDDALDLSPDEEITSDAEFSIQQTTTISDVPVRQNARRHFQLLKSQVGSIEMNTDDEFPSVRTNARP